MAIVTMLNQKGGVGKSTLTFHLGGAAAKLGRKVLLIDNDPQASLTQGALGSKEALNLAPESSLAAIYRGEPIEPESLIMPLPFPGLSLLPNSQHSVSFNLVDPHTRPYEDQVVFQEAFHTLGPAYDLILIDCPPNLYMATWAALAASDALMIPVEPEDFGIQGLSLVEKSINMVRRSVNPDLAMLGVIVSKFVARKAVHKAYEDLLRETYGNDVFGTSIPNAADLPDANMRNIPLSWFRPRCAAAKAMTSLAQEMLDRLASLEARAAQEEAA